MQIREEFSIVFAEHLTEHKEIHVCVTLIIFVLERLYVATAIPSSSKIRIIKSELWEVFGKESQASVG